MQAQRLTDEEISGSYLLDEVERCTHWLGYFTDEELQRYVPMLRRIAKQLDRAAQTLEEVEQ